MSASALLSSLALQVLSELSLPGTQPNELTSPPEPSSACNCHMSFEPSAITEPGQSYRATPMSMAARDPLFRAALILAAEDAPLASDVCIRCHSPIGWLSGRSTPGDGSALTEEDLESVTCDTCHRMVESAGGAQLIGDGQYTLSQELTKRASRGNAPENGHLVRTSTFTGSSELCGACHSLFNPLVVAHDAAGNELGFPYYEQRTYEEWRDSSFATRAGGGQSCADCHMKKVRGRAARQGMLEYTDLRLHAIVGGNSFLPAAINLLDPLYYPVDQELGFVLQEIDDSLRRAAVLEVIGTSTLTPSEVYAGDNLALTVRLTNRTGHKLPSGYPEGRRVYLEVAVMITGAAPVVVSGAWDPASGDLLPDAQLHTYETIHTRYQAGTSSRTRRLLELNAVSLDTRLPPEGFMPSAADMVPAGRDYGSPPYRHWDETTFSIPIPALSGTATGAVSVRAMYQVTDGAYVRFLLRAVGEGTAAGARLAQAWEGTNHAPPRQMAQVQVPIAVRERPDAGLADTGLQDSGQGDGGSEDQGAPGPSVEGGCHCRSGGAPAGAALWPLLALALALSARARARARSRRWPATRR